MRQNRVSRMRRIIVALAAPIVLLCACERAPRQASAMFNCLTPAGGGGGGGGGLFGSKTIARSPMYNTGYAAGADRTGWYAGGLQQQQQPGQYSPYQMGVHPMKMLFQPKWKPSMSGGLFGAMRPWSSPWRSMGSSFYRPGYGYNAAAPMPGYTFNEQLNVAPFAVPPIAGAGYGHTSSTNNADLGWSSPAAYTQQQQQQQYPSNSYAQKPAGIKDPYGAAGTKGGQASGLINRLSSTRKPMTYGYASAGAHNTHSLDRLLLMNNLAAQLHNDTSYGYAYPSWYEQTVIPQSSYGDSDADVNTYYSGSGGGGGDAHASAKAVNSPAKIAQQLARLGLKRQLQDQQQLGARPLNTSERENLVASARLTVADAVAANNVRASLPTNLSSNKFVMHDEPRFVGFGKLDASASDRAARLSCAFTEAIDVTNRPLWVKFLGPYNTTATTSTQTSSDKDRLVVSQPPFNCAHSQCRTQEVEATKDARYSFDHGPATSTLIIANPRPADFGVYRCSALTKTINNKPLETIYQIVVFDDKANGQPSAA